ncbi:MAG: hypothetical protein IH623_03925 [Verrucomicrobia bacterium]|nr:hypothetical protein [Verrucomicrobiota bacterium]
MVFASGVLLDRPPRQLIAGMKANCIGSLLVGLAVVLSVPPALARELRSDDLNYAITIPDGWTVAFQSGSGFSIASPDQNKTITLLVSKAGSGALDSDTIAEIERGLLLAGSEKVSGRNFTVDGVSAYETMHHFGKPPFASSFVGHLILASGKLYNLHGTYLGGDASRAADIQAGLSSFRFLRVPKPPASSGVRRSQVLWIVGVLLVGLIFWAVRNRAA